ncbi:Permease of the drug/metabolite transporter (DMT) superfamily [Seinonella peptonophila]|uniref:Permease of the drug/metabolite transporter (DMT) superfamily n=1 Tax=Seinonella peptonophila TaxID=112248 RepID=A0A1M4XGZ3_9BACL|nr:DMT family transporter [Seinonella peptonophila]SHE92824.1 Permease of the drug/metabolite transporter (DMT) superfamily [Seinonella peptonophila]
MSKRLIYLILLSVALMWGTTYVGSKAVLHMVPPTVAAMIRWGFATLFLAPLYLVRKVEKPRGREWIMVALVGMLGVGLYQALFFGGLHYTTSSDATMILSVGNPGFTVLFTLLFFRQRLSQKQLIGFTIAFIGAILFFSTLQQTNHVDADRLIGIGFMILTACCGAWYAILAGRLMKRFDSLLISIICTFAGTLLLTLMALPELQSVNWKQLPWQFWLVEIFLGLFPSALANLLYFKAIELVGASLAISVNYLVPIISLWLSSLLLNDTITLVQIMGSLIMIIGVWLIQQQTEEINNRKYKSG